MLRCRPARLVRGGAGHQFLLLQQLEPVAGSDDDAVSGAAVLQQLPDCTTGSSMCSVVLMDSSFRLGMRRSVSRCS